MPADEESFGRTAVPNPYRGLGPNHDSPGNRAVDLLKRLIYLGISTYFLHRMNFVGAILRSPHVQHEWFKVGLAGTIGTCNNGMCGPRNERRGNIQHCFNAHSLLGSHCVNYLFVCSTVGSQSVCGAVRRSDPEAEGRLRTLQTRNALGHFLDFVVLTGLSCGAVAVLPVEHPHRIGIVLLWCHSTIPTDRPGVVAKLGGLCGVDVFLTGISIETYRWTSNVSYGVVGRGWRQRRVGTHTVRGNENDFAGVYLSRSLLLLFSSSIKTFSRGSGWISSSLLKLSR